MADLNAIRKKLDAVKAARDSAMQKAVENVRTSAAETKKTSDDNSKRLSTTAGSAVRDLAGSAGQLARQARTYSRQDGGTYSERDLSYRYTPTAGDPQQYTSRRQGLVKDTLRAGQNALQRTQDTGSVQNVGSLYRELLALAAASRERSGDATAWGQESAGMGNDIAAEWYASAARTTGSQADQLDNAAAGLVTGERNRAELDKLSQLGQRERDIASKLYQGSGARQLSGAEQQSAAASTRSDIDEAEAELARMQSDLDAARKSGDKKTASQLEDDIYYQQFYIDTLKKAEGELDSDTPVTVYENDYDTLQQDMQTTRADYLQTRQNIDFIEGEIEKDRTQAEQDDLVSGIAKSMQRDGVTAEDYNADYLQMQLEQKNKSDLKQLFTDDTKENYTAEEYAMLRYAQENYPASAGALEELLDTRADARANKNVEQILTDPERSDIFDNPVGNMAMALAGALTSTINAVDVGLQELDQASGGRRFVNYERSALGNSISKGAREKETSKLASYGSLNDFAGRVLGSDVNIPYVGDMTLADLWNAGTDGLISISNGLLFGHATGLATSLQAGDSAMHDQIDAGADYETARKYGIAAGVNEGLGEQLGFESFIGFGEKLGLFDSTKGRILLGLVLQPLNEGVQEGATEYLNIKAEDYVLGYQSDVAQAERAYMAEGYDYDTARELSKEYAKDRIVDSAIQGVLGGLIRSGGGYIERAPGWVSESRQHNENVGGSILANNNADAMASRISEFTGKTVKTAKTSRQATRQYEKFMEAAGAQISDTMRSEDDQAVVDYYRKLRSQFMESAGEAQTAENGEKSKRRATRKSEQNEALKEGYLEGLLKKAAAGETLNKQEAFAVERSDAARGTLEAIKDGTLTADRTKSEKQIKLANEIAGAVWSPMDGTTEATRAKAQSRAEGMQISDEGASVGGEQVKVNGITQVAGENGEAKVRVTMPDGSAREVNMSDVTFGRENAELYSYAADMESREVANAFRMLYTKDQDMARVATGMNAAYDMGRAGYRNIETVRKSVLTSGLTDQQLTRAYELGAGARAAEQNRIVTAAAFRAKEVMGSEWRGGQVTYDNVNVEALSAEQQRNVELVAVLAGLGGKNVELFESQADENGRYTSENGSYNPKTNTIRLDVNAGRNNRRDSMAQTALIKTMSHELTHDMQKNAPKEYARVRDAVLDVLESQENVDLNDLVDAKLAINSRLSREAALDEVVADACEGMLRDSDFAQRMQQAHPEATKTLGQRLRELLGRIIDAIKAAYQGGRLSREASMLMREAERYREIADMWAEGAQKAAEVTGREQEQESITEAAEGESEAAESESEAVESESEAVESVPEAAETAGEGAEAVPGQRLVGEFDEPARPTEAHIDNRTWESVAEKSVEPFQNDYRIARNYMGVAAKTLLQDANESVPGKRFMNAEGEWSGQKRMTTPVLAELMDKSGWTWDRLKSGLAQISDTFDAGDLETKLPNNVLIKRLELVLDEMLTDGYTTLDGTRINPDTGYLAYKAALPGAAKQTAPEAAAGGVDFGEYVQFSMRDDVKLSERNSEQISVREMLANVIEDASTSADEMAWLKGYRKDLKELDRKLDAIGQNKQIIRELMFKKGRTSEESQRLSKARERLKILNEQVARMDEGLLKLEGSDFIRGLVNREAQKIRDKEAEKRRAGIAKVRETQRNAAVRKNIRQRAKRLDRMLREPTDRDHIPEGLKSAMIDLMDIFTRNDDSAFGGTAKDRERLYRAQSEYMAMQSADPESDIASRYDEDTADRLRQLGDLMKDGKLSDFGAAELAEVSKVLEHFEHLIRDQNDEFRESKRKKTEEYAREIWQQTGTMKGRKENAFTAHALVKAIKHMGQANITPVYFYKHLGGAMGKLGNDLLKAEGRYGVNAGRAGARIEQIKEAHDYKSWAAKKGDILRLETESGDVLELTREQALGIWASAKRERTNTKQRAEHLRTGGVILENAARKAGLKGQELNLTPTRISDTDIARIDGWLTDQQKKYADAMVNYISTDMAELGNETSMELVGYKKFGEGYYYPYKTSSDFRRTNLGNVEQALIKNMGFTKATVRNAKTPVVITDFSQTVADHVNAMLMYNAFAVPQDQLLRVYDFRLDDSTSVKNMLRSAYGDEVPGYIEQQMRDLYGGVSPDRDAGLVNALISGHKRQAVLGSASVVIQQPTAIIRAMSEVNPKYFAGKLPGGGFEEAKQYAGTAVIKDMGGFDTSMSRGATDWINGNTKDWQNHPVRSTVDRINEAAGMGAEKADQLAWSLLWKAVKKEQADLTGLDINSEELKQRAGDRFDEVVRLTQVYDSVMSKSQLMRNKNVFWKGATAFMAEPTLTWNMMVDAVMEARKGNGKKAAGIVGSVLVSIIFTNLAKALVTASRDDDDEEATWLERYVKNATEGIIGDFIPFNYVPIARDVYSRLQGYDVERTDMSIINDILAAGQTILNPDSSPYKRAKSGVQVLSLMTGIPAHNLWREAEAAINTATATPPSKAREGWLENALRTGLVEATPIGKWFDLNDSKSRSTDKLYEALMDGDAESAGEWRSHLMLYNGAEDDAAVNSLLRSRIKEGYENGELDSTRAVDMLTEHTGMKRYDAEKRVAEWSYAVDTGTKYSDLKDEYLSGNLTDEEAIAARVEYGGADEADAADTIAKWRYEKENGIAYADMKDAYIAGDLTEAQAIADMVEYGGKREADARQTVSEWNYEKESGGEWGQMKADYIAGRMTADEVVAAQVKYGGALEKDVRAQLLKWDYERDTGIAYTDMKTAYLEGGISREAAVEARVKYGGLDADAAEQEVSKWNFEADYGYSYDDMRDYYELGNISYDEAVAARVKYGGAQEDDAYFAVAGWEYEQETGDEWDGKFTKIHDAVDSGSSADMRSSIQEVYDHSAYEDGKKAASAVTSNITSTYKPIYLAATPAQRAAMEPILLEAYRLAYELAGEKYYGDSYKLKQIRKWAED